MSFLCSLRLDALLSFRPGSAPIALTPLNVLIGPNGSGKSNLIEAIELLHATPTAFAEAIRDGGGAAEWLWKGEGGGSKKAATIDSIVGRANGLHPNRSIPELRYRLRFGAVAQRTEVRDEVIERTKKRVGQKDFFFSSRFQHGQPAINVRQTKGEGWMERHLERQSLTPDESV